MGWCSGGVGVVYPPLYKVLMSPKDLTSLYKVPMTPEGLTSFTKSCSAVKVSRLSVDT